MERGSRAKFFFFFSGMDCLFVGRFSFLLSLFSVLWNGFCAVAVGVFCVCLCLCVCGCLLKSVNNVN